MLLRILISRKVVLGTPSSLSSYFVTFRATNLFVCMSRALYTAPQAPSPIFDSLQYCFWGPVHNCAYILLFLYYFSDDHFCCWGCYYMRDQLVIFIIFMSHTSITSATAVPVNLRATISICIFQSIFYIVLGLIGYWILTLNFTGLGIFLLISILQAPVKKPNKTYINLVLNVLKTQQFFEITRYYSEQIPADEKSMFTYHPHSIFSYGVVCNANSKIYPGEKLTNAIILGSRFMLYLPIIGMHFRMWGMQSVDPKNLRRLMKQGEDISLLPGGFEEATITTPNQFRVYIKERKGFIKYALKYGYTIRPVLVTNEHKAMNTLDKFLSLRLLINKLKFPAVIFWSKYGPLFPPGVHMHTIIGKGLRPEKKHEGNQEPTNAEINEMHSRYIEEIKKMYEEHKEKNGNVPIALY